MADPIKKVQVIPYRHHPGLEILMLKTIPRRGGFWQCVTGKVEPSEDLKTAALRELAEETGITSRNLGPISDPIYSFEYEKNGKKFIETVFAVQVIGDPKVDLEHNVYTEHVKHQWVPPEDALRRSRFDSQKNSIETFLHNFQNDG
ncbi:MAG: NUDIX pyrophosphatase [Candidatus Thermoplasmatota archaeon]|nr:NUDIX pyrophosphatase [Candidatus Thermoplasmatota archaeon]